MFLEGIRLSVQNSGYYLGLYNLFSKLHANFENLKGRIRRKPKKKSCLFMCLVCAYEISAHLELYIIIYGTLNINCPVLYLLSWADYFVVMENDFEKVFNWKVVDN